MLETNEVKEARDILKKARAAVADAERALKKAENENLGLSEAKTLAIYLHSQ